MKAMDMQKKGRIGDFRRLCSSSDMFYGIMVVHISIRNMYPYAVCSKVIEQGAKSGGGRYN